ncbi:MAG TPA: amidohydrolase family protein [Caulobacteraceae bacterium]|nr:amidohydrolase family protein [Caulobacteraceae bacterium]
MNGGRPAGLIDVHTHVTPLRISACPTPGLAWPCMVCNGPKDATLMVGDKPFRRLDDRSWDTVRRCEDMDRDGVAMQVLSPMPELLSYWFPDADAEYLCDEMNGVIAEMVARDPARFRGLGMAPLQNPERAARYLERLRERFGLSGIEIGSNINGVMPGDAVFAPVMEAAAAHDLAVFVHALHPLSTKAIEGGAMLGPIVGFPMDVALAATSLILGGTLHRLPSLRIGLSHGGGALGALLGRLDQGWANLPELKETLPSRPSHYARRFFFDSNVYDPSLLGYLARDVFAGRIFVGTDYPYVIMQTDPAAFLVAAGLHGSDMDHVARETALLFLNETD